jgi:hypothetical protein
MNAKGYLLEDSEGRECILVIKTEDTSLLYTLVKRMTKMRDERIRELGRALEGELNDRQRSTTEE